MKIKDLALIAGAYIAGNAVASMYATKKGETLKKEIVEDKDNALKILWNNILDLNKKMFNDVKDEVEAMDREEIKKKVLDSAEEFKIKAEELIKEFREKGPEYISEITEKLEKLYNEKKELIEKYKNELPSIFEEQKTKLITYFEEIKKEIKK